MTSELKFIWARLNANYWFYPALFCVAAAVLAFGMIWLDRNGAAGWVNDVEWLIPARPNGASNMLTVMAGSMIGVAATVFSITIAAVAYASGNYGPRLLTNFMEDRGNQLSLATFIGTFVYALIVLRSVRAEDETAANLENAAATTLPGFAPQMSLLVAYLLMAICVAVLVFFLNHIPSSIRINNVLEGIGSRLLHMIEHTYPVEDELGEAPVSQGGAPVLSRSTGYVQLIDFDDLVRISEKHGATLSLTVRTGDFVHRDLPLVLVKHAAVAEIEDAVRDAFSLGPTRTPEQDPQFLVDELVEIGLRALSPGINDPFTAITSMHWLGAATAEIGRRDLRKDICRKDDGECNVIPCSDDFVHYADRGFGSMRSAVATSATASEVMLHTLENAASTIRNPVRRAVLRKEGEMLMAQAKNALTGPDLETVEARYRKFAQAVSARPLREAS